MTRRLHLVTFASREFASARDQLLESARRTGEFDDASSWDRQALLDDPSFPAKPLLAHPRGVGYWAWKPHIILATLNTVRDGDVVVYSDAGRYGGGYTITRSVGPLVDFAEAHDGMLPGVTVPNFGASARWTRRDCFVLMNCDSEPFWSHPQVQASVSLWIKTPSVVSFLEEWRHYCADERIIGDGPNTTGLPNLDGFVDHRHDQSVLTNLVVKNRVTPFEITGRLFDWALRARPQAASANAFAKHIDNISAIAGGASPFALYARRTLASKLPWISARAARRGARS